MNLKQKIEIILEYKFCNTRRIEDLDDQQKSFIQSVYFEVTGRRMELQHSGCTSCYEIGFSQIRAYYLTKNQSKMKNEKSQFRLKAGIMIQLHGIADVITEDNCTDANCLALLKTHPKAIANFDVFPDDYREQAENFDPIAGMGHAKKETKEADDNGTEDLGSANKSDDSQDDKGGDVNGKEERRQILSEKTKAELQEFVGGLDLPVDEWEKLNKKDLVEYILEKNK